MILVDTNVLSELARPRPEPAVVSWLDSLPSAEVATTTITAAELRYGVARLPEGRRRTELAAAVRGVIDEDFRDRVEPFDTIAADHYANVVRQREELGRPISMADAQIAAICHKLEARLATHNTRDFEDTGLDLIDPWQGP